MLAESDWSSIVAAIAAIVAAGFAVWATIISYILYRSETDPHVIVYAKVDQSRPTIILLVIENIGRGVARNVHFHISEAVPSLAWGVNVDDAPAARAMTAGPLIEGIASLEPNGSRIITWGQYGGLRRAIGERTINVTATFTRENGSNCYPIESLLEMRSFFEVDIVDPDGARKLAHTFEKIITKQGLRVTIQREE